MKNSANSFFLILATGVAGVIAFSLANSSFLAGVSADVLLAAVTSVTLVGFAINDYSRRVQALESRSRLLRPALPADAIDCLDRKDRLAA